MTHHDNIDTMPFTNIQEVPSGNQQEKKESFVDYLLNQYMLEQKLEEVQCDHADIVLLRQHVETLQQQVALLQNTVTTRDEYSEAIEGKITSLSDDITKLKSTVTHTPAVKPVPQERVKETAVVPPPMPASHKAHDTKQMVAYYQQENIRLKNEHVRLMRRYNQERLGSAPTHASVQEQENPFLAKQVQYLLKEIEKLEGKKTELINDNIQINDSTHNILEENIKLQDELEQFRKQCRERQSQ